MDYLNQATQGQLVKHTRQTLKSEVAETFLFLPNDPQLNSVSALFVRAIDERVTQ